jgi:hypothetical protein
MGEGRNNGRSVSLRDVGDGDCITVQLGDPIGGGAPDIKAHVEGHLIVAAACRVELAGNISNQIEQTPFDGAVHVFVGIEEDEALALRFFCYVFFS